MFPDWEAFPSWDAFPTWEAFFADINVEKLFPEVSNKETFPEGKLKEFCEIFTLLWYFGPYLLLSIFNWFSDSTESQFIGQVKLIHLVA
jgi:hypothetical protein